MLDSEVVEIVGALRALGTDVSDIEAKKAAGGLPKSLRETLSAFSNTSGGIIILGLDESDGFRSTGVSDPAKMSADLASMCATEMEPPVRPIISQVKFEDVWLIVAEVPELPQGNKPSFYKGRGMNSGSYIRVNDGDHQLSTYEVQTIVSNRGQPTDDIVPVSTAEQDALDDKLVREYVERVRVIRPYAFGELTDALILQRSKMLVPDVQGNLRPSLAGLLALGTYPQEHYPQLNATLVVYPTDEGPDVVSGRRFLDNVTLEGPIPIMARDALAAVRRNMRRRSTVSGVGRTEVWEYPESALREAIVNALVHRDLSPAALGTQVQIEMYPNRIVIRNPGGLYGPVSVQHLTEEGTSSSRNAFLLKALEDISLPGENRTVCENRGSGIRTMIESLRQAGMSMPKFDDKISSFTVTFPNHTLLDDEAVEWLTRLGETGLSDAQCVGLAMIRNESVSDNASYRAATGLDSRVATAELQDLVSRELVIPVGSGRWTQYKLSARSRGAASGDIPKLVPRDRRNVVLGAIGDRQMSRAEIEELSGLGKQVVIHWLRILRKEHLVRIVGGESPQSRNVRYERTPETWGQDTLNFGDDA